MRKFTLPEMTRLILLGDRMRREIDTDLGNLVIKAAEGDESAFVAAVDKLYELGRDAQADQLKRLVVPA
ncbi:unnamed protein product [Gemmataceae bacterium]|nr:unnamed protein product [Gemmataceae bacterium]VTT98924.1 unnamed protein product [Gemmataceae bacterium]